MRLTATLALSLAALAQADCGPFFRPLAQIATGPQVPAQFLVRNIDGVGFPEVLYGSRTSTAGVTIFRRDEQTGYQAAQFLPVSPNPSFLRFLLEDTDRDGVEDIIVTDYAAASVRIFPGQGSGAFATTGPAYGVGPTPSGLAYEDLNNDGVRDLVVSNFSDDTVSILMGAPGGGFFPRTTVPAGGDAPNWVGLADINGDGRLDLLTSVTSPTAITCSLGNGSGTFQTPQVFSTIINPALTSHIIQDMNNDSVPDIVASASSDHILIFRGVANGTFVPVVIPTDFNIGVVRAVAVSDYNGDAYPDVLTLQGTGESGIKLIFHANRPGLNFSPGIEYGSFSQISGQSHALLAADVNGDSLDDAILCDRFGQIAVMEASTGGPVQIQSRPENQTVSPGTTVQFTAASSSPGATYRWYRDNTPVLESPKFSGANTPTLTITDAQPSDAAIYECRISNICDTKSVTAFLSVAGPIRPCPADFNGDDFLDFFDYDDFVQAFEEGC
jgi:hypothetical protein